MRWSEVDESDDAPILQVQRHAKERHEMDLDREHILEMRHEL